MSRRFTIPAGFPEIFKGFSREALRSLPTDIADADVELWLYEFGASYFGPGGGAHGGGGGRGGLAGLFSGLAERMSAEELREKIIAIFLSADEDRNGYLDHREFKKVVSSFSEELGLPNADVRRIMSEADENDDGYIEYHEFVPLAVDVIDTIYAKRAFDAEKAARESEAVDASRQFLLHGMPREELERVMDDMFRRADADNDGFLSRAEFTAALHASDLGLTRKEINVLMAEADENEDGKISFEEFLPLCFNLLVEIVSLDYESEALPRDEKEIKDFFMALFTQADTEGTGRLRAYDIQELVRQGDLGLTSVQLYALMSEAVEDEAGLVNYDHFATAASTIIAKITQVQTNAEKAERAAAYRQSEEYATVYGMSREEFDGALLDALSAVDTERSGRVPYDAVVDLLSNTLQLDSRSVGTILGAAGADADGRVDTTSLANYAFGTLQELQLQEKMRTW